MGNTYLLSVTLVQNLKSSWHTEVICSKQIFLAMDELFPELLWIALFVGGDSSVQGLTIPVLCPSCRQSTHLFDMWKVVLLGLYTMLAVRGLAKGAPFEPEEKWKPLDNPRNRDLVRKCCKKHSLSFLQHLYIFIILLHMKIKIRAQATQICTSTTCAVTEVVNTSHISTSSISKQLQA